MSPRRWLVSLGCAVLVLAGAACQPLAVGEVTATPATPVTTPAAATIADTGVWARVPWCNCLDGTATKNVSLALERAQLENTLKVLNPTDGYLYFVVGFDPETISREQIAAAIVDGGGEVMDGPP